MILYIVQSTAKESYIDNWTSFNLDTEPGGSTYKPDSFLWKQLSQKVRKFSR